MNNKQVLDKETMRKTTKIVRFAFILAILLLFITSWLIRKEDAVKAVKIENVGHEKIHEGSKSLIIPE